ncbi:MAG TPA: flagellar biosynthesis protein FlhF [Burkholderiales bacterium]|nr:flagellar biosynthesis protein FlhF [Burkholderiales bacterium]
MNARKFFGANSSEALREVKRALGADAVVLANRRVGGQVEITALAPEALARLTSGASSSAAPPEAAPAALRKNPRGGTPPERPAPPPSAACSEPSVAHLMSELKALRGTMESQLAGIAWSDLQRREPLRARLLREMLGSGFTPALARLLADGSPAGRDYEDTIQWAQAVLARNLLVADDDEIVARGGVYALVGPTGVGKTTTTAKLAARCVVRHGAERLALLTTDGYRVGAHEQLRIYGKILGVAVHAVRDAEDLRVRLAELGGKHLVLIDTMGMGQRDRQVAEQTGMLTECGVRRLLLLTATAGAEQLEDVARAYRGDGIHGAILTKADEAVSIAGALDVALRYKLTLHYAANGQRVPEDLHPARCEYLAHRALRPRPADTAGGLTDAEVPFMLGRLAGAAARPTEMTFA